MFALVPIAILQVSWVSILPTCCCQRGELAIFSTHFAHPGLHYFAGSGSANKIFVHDMIFYVLVHFMDFYVFLCNPHITKCRILACTPAFCSMIFFGQIYCCLPFVSKLFFIFQNSCFVSQRLIVVVFCKKYFKLWCISQSAF